MADSDNTGAFAHYREALTADVRDAFEAQIAGPTHYASQVAKGLSLKWMHKKCNINGRDETRVFVWWHDQNGPVQPPHGFPALELITPVAPVKGMYILPKHFLNSEYNADLNSATQRITFDTNPADSELFAKWLDFIAMADKLFNEDRVRYLADHADELEGVALSKGDRAFLKKCRDKAKKGDPASPEDQLYKRLLDQLEDSSHRGQHRCNKYAELRRKILGARRKTDNVQCAVCPADQLTLEKGFDEGDKIANHLSASHAAGKPLSLSLLKIKLPNDQFVKPEDLKLLHARGAVGAAVLTCFGLHKRADDQHSVTIQAPANQTGLYLWMNGEDTVTGPSVDILSQMRAKRPRIDSD